VQLAVITLEHSSLLNQIEEMQTVLIHSPTPARNSGTLANCLEPFPSASDEAQVQ
jgi:hypothetical protein